MSKRRLQTSAMCAPMHKSKADIIGDYKLKQRR
jgi:hypothetical protein